MPKLNNPTLADSASSGIINKQSGFTLIELLVVIAIIGILSTLAVIALGNTRTKARDSKRLTDLNQIGKALDLYYSDQNYYPTIITPGNSLASPDGTKVYMAKIPSNPRPRNENGAPDLDYVYSTDTNTSNPPNKYELSTSLGTPVNTIPAGRISVGGSGGSSAPWSCGQKIADQDNNQYDTVQIGSQCWMKQNLNTGTRVDGVEEQDNDSLIEKYCYNDHEINPNPAQTPCNNGENCGGCDTHGALYQWAEATALPYSCNTNTCSVSTPQKGICPVGWHIPTDTEFNALEKYTVQVAASSASQYDCDTIVIGWQRCADNANGSEGGAKGAGRSLKKAGQGSGNGAGDDLVGFSALLAGYRSAVGSFHLLKSYSYIRQVTQDSETTAWKRGLVGPDYSTVLRVANNKAFGNSVRCLKD